MLEVLGNRPRVCSGPSRRAWLQAAGAGLFGASLAKVWEAEAVQAAAAGAVARRARAKSVIFVFLFGGPSQTDTLDMKPDAPDTIRGPFRPIASKTPEIGRAHV